MASASSCRSFFFISAFAKSTERASFGLRRPYSRNSASASSTRPFAARARPSSERAPELVGRMATAAVR